MIFIEYYAKKFKEASLTGRQVLILKADGQCDCYDPNNLIDSEPKPRCKNCFGTGKKRVLIKTEIIRYELSNSGDAAFLEKTDYIKSTHDLYSFFFPKHYFYIQNEDIIITFDEQGFPYAAYEIVNKEKFVKNDFVYYEVFAKKITYLPMELIDNV